MRTSVLIPSWQRGDKLRTCLLSLAKQTVPPDEVIVAWQGDDTATRDLAESCVAEVNYLLRVLHAPQGIVPAENFALDAARGGIVMLIDDDAIAPPDWVAKHLSFYDANPRCGGVGGPAINFDYGRPLPRRSREPIGRLMWYGAIAGNMYDHIDAWKTRPPIRVHHLVGYNMSLRREAFDCFEQGLRPYWQLFELDACLQVLANGWEIWFDFSNVIEHHPSSKAYHPERTGDLTVKFYNLAYNHAFVLSKFSPWYLRAPRLAYMLLWGTTRAPGVASFLWALAKFGHLRRESTIFVNSIRSCLDGWREGRRARCRQDGAPREVPAHPTAGKA
jgi:GT2 family glycosyltransferase